MTSDPFVKNMAACETRYYLAMQTFFGSVKKPAFAKATARQAQRSAEFLISLYKRSWLP